MLPQVTRALLVLGYFHDSTSQRNVRYSTPLHDAVCCGRQEVVRILLERGAEVNEIDYKNMTPLKLAIR